MTGPDKYTLRQIEVCERFQAGFLDSDHNSKLGISLNVRDGILPINGLRHPPEDGTCGWYVWAGERLSDDPDFFRPLHIAHLEEWCPQIIKYLGLPPGWRFLLAEHYEDVWFDPTLLKV